MKNVTKSKNTLNVPNGHNKSKSQTKDPNQPRGSIREVIKKGDTAKPPSSTTTPNLHETTRSVADISIAKVNDLSLHVNAQQANEVIIHDGASVNTAPSQKKNTFFLTSASNTGAIAPESGTTQIRVISRFRPLNAVEEEMLKKDMGSLCVNFKSEDSVTITNHLATPTNFTLDRIFDIKSTQAYVYEQVARPTIEDVLRGYNGTIFTYGQSGSGKTFTMYGSDLYNDQYKGIIPRTISDIFAYIHSEQGEDVKFELKFSMLQIYKENIYDLLNPDMKYTDLKIKEHPKKGIYVTNLSEEYITCEEEFIMMIEQAEEHRVVSETGLNSQSSRSHLVFQLEITQKFPDDTERRGILNLVDLAGSEKISKTHAIGDTLEEAKKINLSLSTLGNVISALTSGSGEFVPYRDSKLTRILQDSLGGNYKTTLIVTCSPHIYNCEETISTLKFASRAKKIKNKVKMNIKRSTEQLEAMIEFLHKQLKLANDEIVRLKGNPVSTGVEPPKSGDENQNLIELKSLHSFYDPGQMSNFPATTSPDTQKLLKQKDEEISNLKESIDNLTSENRSLQEKIIDLIKDNNFDKILSELEDLTRTNIDDLKSFSSYQENLRIDSLVYENQKLAKNYKELETKYLSMTKEKTINWEKVTNTHDIVINNNYILNSYESFREYFEKTENDANPYKEVYETSRSYMKEILTTLTKKRDLFDLAEAKLNGAPSNSSSSHVSREEYTELKTTCLKLTMIGNYYERVLNDFMNRVMIDIRRFDAENKLKVNLDQKCENFNKILLIFLDVLEQLKQVKARKESSDDYGHRQYNKRGSGEGPIQEVEETVISDKNNSIALVENSQINLKENRLENKYSDLKNSNIINYDNPSGSNNNTNNGFTRHKTQTRSIVRHVTKNSTKMMSGFGMLLKTMLKNGGDNAGASSSTILPLFSGPNGEALNNMAASIVDVYKQQSGFSPMGRGVHPHGVQSDQTHEDGLGPDTTEGVNEFNLVASKKSFNKMRGWDFLKGSMISNNLGNSFIGKKPAADNSELKQLRKEYLLYKNSVEYLSNEINRLKSFKSEMNKTVTAFEKDQKSLYNNQVENLTKSIEVFRRFYEEELSPNGQKTFNLILERTEILANQNKHIVSKSSDILYPRTVETPVNSARPMIDGFNINTSLPSQFFSHRKEISAINSNRSFNELASSYIKDSGSATKKLDYVLFHMDNKYNDMLIEYGSGLHGMFPSKSPLNHNLSSSLLGDAVSDVPSPEVTD